MNAVRPNAIAVYGCVEDVGDRAEDEIAQNDGEYDAGRGERNGNHDHQRVKHRFELRSQQHVDQQRSPARR